MDVDGRPIVFLGGIFTPLQTDLIHTESKGVIQNAADALQKSLIRGLAAHRPSLTVLNLPFIGSYPRLFRRPRFPATRETIYSNVAVEGRPFNLMRVIKPISRLGAAFRGLVALRPPPGTVIVVYSAHLPFMAAALLYRAFAGRVRICQVLPDFPEFMGEGGLLYRTAKSVEARLFYALARRIDGFVLLTRFMADRLGLEPGRYTVVEGIAEPASDPPAASSGSTELSHRAFLYTGTLAARYGIMDLVEAFRQVRHDGIRLWICGEGDSRGRIEAAAAQDPRIRYLGQVSRSEAREWQARASVLVNPRPPTGEFTRYSFPSKTLEYMASGRPVLMHRLDGIPDDYTPFYVRPASADVRGLADAIRKLADCSEADLRAKGEAARDFVLRHKTAAAQCRKIIDLIDSFPSS